MFCPPLAGRQKGENVNRVAGVPRLSRTVIPRPRLESLLDDALAEQLTIVRAPIGYGKTTLVGRWLSSIGPAGKRAAWIDLRSVSRDAASFWQALDDVQSLDTQSDPSIVVVLDGYDRQWDSRLSSDLMRLVHRSPDLHLVILTQTMTSFEAPATAAGIDLRVITTDDLALTRDELERASGAIGLTAASATLDSIARITRGWPLAVRALFRVIGAGDSELAADALDRALVDFSGELLKRLDASPDELAALQRSAVAPYLTSGIVECLAPDADGDAVISAVERAGLGTWTHRYGNGRPVFEILEPIKRGLLTRLEAAEPAAHARLTQRVAGVLEVDGDPLSALRHALRAKDVAVAEMIVVRQFSSVFGAGAGDYFGALQPIDPAAFKASTVLLTVTGLLTEFHGDGISAAMPYYLTAADLPPSRLHSREPGHRFWADLASMIAFRKAGRMAEAATHLSSIQSADAAVPAFAWAEIGITRLRLGSTAEAVASFRRTVLMADHDPDLVVFALGSKALAHAVRGEIGLAAAVCRRIDERAGVDAHLMSRSLVPARIARHIIATERGDANAAGPVAHGLDDAQFGEFRQYAVFARALRAACHGERSGALDILECELMSKHSPPASNVEHAPLVSLRATLLVAEGSVIAAEHVITSFPDGTGALRIVAARLALMRRDYCGAQVLAEQPLTDKTSVRDRVEALLVRGSAMKRIGHRSASGDAFDQAVRISESHQLTTPFALAIRQDVSGLLAAQASRLRGARELVPLLDESTMAAELTQRERVVLERLSSNASLDVIAASLVVSVNTVKTQTSSLYRKLGASSRQEAVRIAREAGLLHAGGALGRPLPVRSERVA
jgi:LuxR family maltose regulon positive regulatory protein